MTRQDAIWHANHVFNIVIERCFNAQNLKDAREFDEAKQIVIEALQQEPKRGKWILGKEISREYIGDVCVGIEYDGWQCSSCKTKVEKPYKPNWNYCPNCGVKMEVEE